MERKVSWFFMISLFLWIPGLLSCKGSDSSHRTPITECEPVSFAVVSDTHIYDAALGTSGAAYDVALRTDRTLIAESSAIFAQMSNFLIHHVPRPQFLLIPGDLTREGTLESHLLTAEYLHILVNAGIGVFVIPGNHDIANPHASGYTQEGREFVESISASDFADIYYPFGYKQAIARDPYSLSYIAEPASGYWLFGIDSCRYAENDLYPVIGGRLSENSLRWLKEHLVLARKNGKQVIAMMHHSLNEHAIDMGRYLPEFVLSDWQNVRQQLAEKGLNLVFTGHFHAQKITRWDCASGDFLVDIQTGALSAWPNPFRLVTLNTIPHEIAVETRYVENIPAFDSPESPLAFRQYSREFSDASINAVVRQGGIDLLNLSAQQKEQYIPLIREAANAFFYGDQKPTLNTVTTIIKLSASANDQESTIGALLFSLWHDLAPQDNNLIHMLETQEENF